MPDLSETVNQEINNDSAVKDEEIQDTGGNESEKTFTQEQVNLMITKRVEREKKVAEALQAHQSELEAELNNLKRTTEINNLKQKIANETGVPVHLLHGEDEKTCKAESQAILDFARPKGYPKIKDAGEIQPVTKKSTEKQLGEYISAKLSK